MGKIMAVNISEKKGTQKKNIHTCEVITDFGLKDDAHAGKWHRQVSLLSYEKIEAFKAMGAPVDDGAFGENLIVQGFDLRSLPIGTRFQCNDVILELTQIGKKCHSGCEIYKVMGDCIMPREGVFTKVLQGGTVSEGDTIEIIEKPMDYSRLESNIIDVIHEGQVKLGFQKEYIRLYYPLQSLNRFLETNADETEMEALLKEFADTAVSRLGATEISHDGDRFCLCMSPQASEYVHTHAPKDGFLYDFINTVSRHGITIEDVLDQFRKYSDKVHIEQQNHGEFDWLVYFEDGKPDAYRYCLTDEGHHVIYHRYTKEDFEDLNL